MRKRLIFVPVLLLVLFTILIGANNKAQAFEILCEPYPGTSFVYDLSELEEEWHEHFKEALKKWQGFANVRLSTGSGDGSGIKIAVRMEAHEGADWAGLGICGIERNPYIMINSYYVETEAQFTRVAVHEIGHTLGLYHSNDLQSVMNIEPPRTSAPNEDDVAGLRYIYGLSIKDADSENGSPYPCEAPYPEIRAGSEGSCVQFLQWLLNKERESPNKLLEDGKVNRTIIRIVKRHQMVNNLSARGFVDVETWNSILKIDKEEELENYNAPILDGWLSRLLVWRVV